MFTLAIVAWLYGTGERIAALGFLSMALVWTFIDWIGGTLDDEKPS